MKLRILFLRKKHIFYFLLVLVVFTFFIISRISTKDSSPIFKVSSFNKVIKADLTGDGKGDVLYISTINKDKYVVQVSSQKETFPLEPESKLPTLGTHSDYWPMRIKLYDISRDNFPEIFIQSSENNKAIQHVFIYNNGKFQDVFSSNNNLIGFLDVTNNKTPKFISGKIGETSFSISNYILIQGKFQKYDYNTTETFMGKDTIQSFITMLTSKDKQNLEMYKEILDSKLYSSLNSVINKIISPDKSFIFQDAIFMDTKSNSNGDPSDVQWTLNFKENLMSNPDECKNLTVKVTLRIKSSSADKYQYKICYIN